MNRRQLLAGIMGCLVSLPLWAAPDPRLQDLKLEEQISHAQSLCVQAGKAYQDWMYGRVTPMQARATVQSGLTGLEAFQRSAALLAVPGAQTSIRHWSRMQKQELKFFLDDMSTSPGQRRSMAELQKRWQNAVEIQADLLETRRRQLTVLETSKGPAGLQDYYRWKRSLLMVLQAELDLARSVAEAFESKKTGRFTGQAVSLTLKAEQIPAPTSCRRAQTLYLERFSALSRVCRDAESAITAPDQDSAANLQDTEATYRQKVLASDDASLAALRSLLSKTR